MSLLIVDDAGERRSMIAATTKIRSQFSRFGRRDMVAATAYLLMIQTIYDMMVTFLAHIYQQAIFNFQLSDRVGAILLQTLHQVLVL